jgi:hypothetical protein
MNDKKNRNTEESIFEKVIGEAWKGRVKNVVGDFKLPKEALGYILNQVDETKHAAVGIISKEVRQFLENTDIANEITKVLTRLSLEITTNIKFTDNGGNSPEIKFKVTSGSTGKPKENSSDDPDDIHKADNPSENQQG